MTKGKSWPWIAGVFALWLVGCTDLKSGGDRANDDDGGVDSDGGAGMSGHAGMSGAGGSSGASGTGGAGAVPPTVTRFSTLSEPRSGDGASIQDDGFELSGRRCTANGSVCVTGGFGP